MQASGDGDDSGGDDREKPLGADEDQQPSGDGGGKNPRGRKTVSLSINKWAKPIPKLDLPPRAHLQKASKIKQVWELWSMNAALATSTWTDVAVTFWHQVYHQPEESYQDWLRSSMTERFAYEKRYFPVHDSSNQPFFFSAHKTQHYMGLIFKG